MNPPPLTGFERCFHVIQLPSSDSTKPIEKYTVSQKWNQTLAFLPVAQNQRMQLGYEAEKNFPMVVSRSRPWGAFALQIRNFSGPQKGPRSASP